MKDGFYLATYLNPTGLHRLAHVRLRHDNNLSLWEKTGNTVRLVRHWELERISGQKMHRTPFLDLASEVAFVNNLLAPFDLKLGDMVEVWGTPELDTVDDYHLVAELPHIAFHSVAHLYSAILMDSEVYFDGTIIGLAVDRGPDRLLDRRFKDHWFAGCVVRAGEVDIFPVESPGPLYSEARDRFGMREGSLMALATASRAAGECDRAAILADFRFDRADAVELSRAAFDRIHRQVAATVTADPAFTDEENLVSAVMKEVQAISVAIMERNVERICAEHGIDTTTAHLAIAGGYALNCPTNSHLMAKYGFRGFLAPPSVGDDGQSVGIALAAFAKKMPGRFDFRYPGPYLGRTDTDLDAALERFADFVAGATDYAEDTAVDDILAGPVVWLDGPSEVGPRALGNRSILGDPTTTASKDALNRVKRREWWRPVAPVVLEEALPDWFLDSRPSPYMLETFTIRPDRRAAVPAVAHLDQSARVQSVSREHNPVLHGLISAFARRTGVPMLCNTSLNDKGEPIIDRIAEAISFCLTRGVPVAYLAGRRVALHGFDRYPLAGPLPRAHEPFSVVPADRAAALRAELNPHGLDDVRLHLYLADLELCAREDIRTEDGARAVRAILDRRLAERPELLAATERAIEKNRVHFSAYGWQPLIPDHRGPATVSAEDRADQDRDDQNGPAMTETTTTTAAVSEHVLGQVAGAELAEEPWPHAYLPRALPADLALRLSRSFDRLDMAFFEQTGTEKSYRLRTADLTDDTARALGTDWQLLRDVLAGPAYREHISALTGVSLEDSTFSLNLWEYRTGDWLAPHVDKPEKLVTQIFYLSEGWQPDDDGRLLVLATADPASVVRTLPPRLGSSAILVRSDSSWHAVAAPGPSSPARRSVTATFWQRGGPARRADQ